MALRWSRKRTIVVVVIAVLVAAAIGITKMTSAGQRTVTAYFASAASLYPGNPVEVLGVPIGSVASVTPEPNRVKVVMHIDDDVKLPAGVAALQVSPSLISGRSITLAPAYTTGPLLEDNAVIPIDRTEVPLDVNDLFRNVSKLAKTLGPDGVNKNGSLNRFLDVLAANLQGNGSSLAATIDNLGDATTTLAGSSDDLTGTIAGLQKFVTTLASHDGGMRELNEKLASVSGMLATDRDDLAGALQQLSTALGTVGTFVQKNRSALKSNVDRLSKVSAVLVKERAILGQIIDEAPTGLGNLFAAYNAAGGTLDVRIDINELQATPGALLCTLVGRTAPGGLSASLIKTCSQLTKALSLGGKVPDLSDLLALLQGNKISGAK